MSIILLFVLTSQLFRPIIKCRVLEHYRTRAQINLCKKQVMLQTHLSLYSRKDKKTGVRSFSVVVFTYCLHKHTKFKKYNFDVKMKSGHAIEHCELYL